MKRKLLTLATAAALTLGSTTALAFPFFPGSGHTAGAQAEDDNLDFHIDNDGDGMISVGDQLISVMEFNAIVDIFAANGSSPSFALDTAKDELVALADVTVTSIGANGAGALRVGFGATAGTSAVRAFNLGSSVDLDIGTFANCTNLATCTASVVDGTPWAEFSFLDADDEWYFESSIGPGGLVASTIAGLGAVTKVGTVNFALSLVPGTDFTGYTLADQTMDCLPGFLFTCAGDGKTTLVGSADILGGGGLPAGLGAMARSDTDVALNVIPEPGSIALLGLGLLGLGAIRRKKA